MITEESKAVGLLLKWAENYFRSRDAFHKKIVLIGHEENCLIITFKEKKETVFAVPDLNNFKCQKHSAGLIDPRTKSANSCGKQNVSEHAQEPPVSHRMARKAPPSMPPVCDGWFLTDLNIKENTSIITINNRKNAEYLYDNWSKLINFPLLKIYFINPLSTTEKKWVINPHIHSKICDKDTLKAGIMAMFETVEPLTKEILQARL